MTKQSETEQLQSEKDGIQVAERILKHIASVTKTYDYETSRHIMAHLVGSLLITYVVDVRCQTFLGCKNHNGNDEGIHSAITKILKKPEAAGYHSYFCPQYAKHPNEITP